MNHLLTVMSNESMFLDENDYGWCAWKMSETIFVDGGGKKRAQSIPKLQIPNTSINICNTKMDTWFSHNVSLLFPNLIFLSIDIFRFLVVVSLCSQNIS